MSIPEKSEVATSSTVMCWPFHSKVVPEERDEEKNRMVSTGKSRSARRVRMTRPTCPVAPTTATFNPLMILSFC